MIYGRRQPSRDGTSRMNREVHVRICERLGVKFPGPTRQFRKCWSQPGATLVTQVNRFPCALKRDMLPEEHKG